jgi:TPR repeat protein
MAWHVGTYTYSTVNGGSRTIHKLDYGIPCDPPPELIQKQIEAAKAKAILDKKRAEQAQVNAVKWLQPQATNGSAYAQYSLGLHYLSGQGCETNREQAIYWLQKAATQGDLEASNALIRLQK